MNQTLACLSVVLLLAGCATTTADSPPAASEPGAEAAPGDDGTKVRCVYTTGTRSRLAERECRTEAEWERLKQARRPSSFDASGGGS
jgi:hypothetical protein